jgi:hypothetical protein
MTYIRLSFWNTTLHFQRPPLRLHVGIYGRYLHVQLLTEVSKDHYRQGPLLVRVSARYNHNFSINSIFTARIQTDQTWNFSNISQIKNVCAKE